MLCHAGSSLGHALTGGRAKAFEKGAAEACFWRPSFVAPNSHAKVLGGTNDYLPWRKNENPSPDLSSIRCGQMVGRRVEMDATDRLDTTSALSRIYSPEMMGRIEEQGTEEKTMRKERVDRTIGT